MQMKYARLAEFMHRRTTGKSLKTYMGSPTIEHFEQLYDDELKKAGLA